MKLVLQIEGSAINDIASLYAEINRVFMVGEAWQLGPSLDALDDLLRGGYGALAGQAQVTLIWRDIAHSRTALGMEATRQWLQAKLDNTGCSFNTQAIAAPGLAGPAYRGRRPHPDFEIVHADHRQPRGRSPWFPAQTACLPTGNGCQPQRRRAGPGRYHGRPCTRSRRRCHRTGAARMP